MKNADKPELETINKMYLELSQFATARTEKEIKLIERIKGLQGFLQRLYNMGKDGWDYSNKVNTDLKLWMEDNAELLKELEES